MLLFLQFHKRRSLSNPHILIVMNIKNKDGFSWWIIAIILLFLTIIVFIVNGNTWATQVLAACLGAIITIIATRLLLSSQSKIEEKQREAEDDSKRKLELHNAKLKVYSDFVSKMYEILKDNKIDEKEILDLRTRIFGQVSFYASGDIILEKINKELENVNPRDIDMMQLRFARIAGILQKDLRENLSIKYESYNSLWNTFNGMLEKYMSSGGDKDSTNSESHGVSKINNTTNNEIITEGSPDFLNNDFWHFAMWGAEEQIKSLQDGIHELNLVEYGEDWRTNLIKKVQKDDLIFLFRSGGMGYMGVYRALGWRIFEFGDNDYCRETMNMFGEPQVVIDTNTDKNKIEKYLAQSDIYESREDGATLCSSIIVEPLAFSTNGIQNPGGVYRRTISHYDYGYGIKQLERFMTVLNDENGYKSMVEMGCNIDLFKRILSSGEIQPASRDDNGNWLN